MKDNTFTQQELDDAKTLLLEHIHEFHSNTDMGHHLRKDTIRAFKYDYSIKTDDEMILHINADLANDIDVSNALILEELYDKETSTRHN